MRCKETCFMTHLPLDEVCAEHWMPSEFPQVEGLLNPLIYVPCSSFCRRDTLDIFRYCLLLWLTRMPLLHTHVLYYADISSNCHLSVYGGIAWSIHLSSDQNPGDTGAQAFTGRVCRLRARIGSWLFFLRMLLRR